MASPSQSKVCFFFDSIQLSLPNRSGLKKFIEGIFKKEKTSLDSLNYIFCTDERLLGINRDYLKHDYYTDIITFDLSEGESIQGEVYISIDRVRENAKTHGVGFQQELKRVIFHGALHLCGYKDKSKKDITLMRQKEDFYLETY
jgi:rRNA maturation RNase YbeY